MGEQGEMNDIVDDDEDNDDDGWRRKTRGR